MIKQARPRRDKTEEQNATGHEFVKRTKARRLEIFTAHASKPALDCSQVPPHFAYSWIEEKGANLVIKIAQENQHQQHIGGHKEFHGVSGNRQISIAYSGHGGYSEVDCIVIHGPSL